MSSNYGFKVCWIDGSTTHGFRWPTVPGTVVEANRPDRSNTGPCPSEPGDGLCVALSWEGACSGGIPAHYGFDVTYEDEDVLGRGRAADKVRVSRATVASEMLDIHAMIRMGHLSDLRYANLAGAHMSGADLSGLNLYGAVLHCAKLARANLYRANMRYAILFGTDMSGADLSGATLYKADLRHADLSGADMSGAYLSDARLSRASLVNADMRGANLSGADLRDANMKGANMDGVLMISERRGMPLWS